MNSISNIMPGKNTMIVLGVILVIVVIAMVISFLMTGHLWKLEGFAEEENKVIQEESVQVGMIPAEEQTGRIPPFVDVTTGTIMDGPGFERGPVEGSAEVPDQIPSNYYFLDDGAGGEMSIQHNLCSKSCCSAQWPTPFKQKYDPYVCGNKDNFIPSNIMCNNTFNDSGCLCLSKKQGQFLYNRGGNGREWF